MSPKVPCDVGQQHAKQKTATLVRRERAEVCEVFVSPSHEGRPAIFVNVMSQGVGGEEIKIIFYHKKPSWTVANPTGRKRGELRGDASYRMKACRCSTTSLREWVWTARRKGRSPAGVLRLPPVSTASKSSRTPPAFSLRLVWYVKYWTASSQQFHHQQHRPHPHQALQMEGVC